jgi:protease I
MDKTAPSQRLSGLAVAIVAGNGFEQAELVEPRRALDELGVTTFILAVSRGQIQGFHHDRPGDRFDVDLALEEARPEAFDGILLPGGVRNSDMIRASQHAQQFVQAMDQQDKPLAVICHGAWLLVSAGLVRGRTLTSWPTLQADIVNAGGHWRDAPVVVDRNWVSSRKPADIPQFNEKFIQLLDRHLQAAHTHG